MPSDVPKTTRSRRSRTFNPKAPTAVKLRCEPVTLLQLTADTCRFPLGEDARTQTYCGAPPLEGAVYCLDHCQIAYQPARSAVVAPVA